MSARPALLMCGALTFGALRSIDAQRVRGVVRDSATDQPVAGAVVWLSDSAGKTLARSIGDGAAKFAVMRIYGARVLHVIHIGYRPKDVRLTDSPVDSVYDVQLVALPPMLATMKTSAERVCPGTDDQPTDAGRAALDLWEQARTALLATVVARESSVPRIQMMSFQKELDPVRKRVEEEHTSSKYVVGDKSYVAARPSWAFVDDGYMQEERDGTRTFYAPDEDVLLDRRFVETHCLHVARAERGEHANDIGLAFEPAQNERRDTLVDITGVLWIDKTLASLKSLEFKYTGLEHAADRSDGKIIFETMPNGAPMIQQWVIRSTMLAIDVPAHPDGIRHHIPPRQERTDVRTLGYREEGGMVAEVVWPDGTAWHADLPRITGVVVDTANKPLAGIRVWLANTPDSTTSNAKGEFALPYVLPRIYTLMASDSVLATKGVTRMVPGRLALFSAKVGQPGGVASSPLYADTRVTVHVRPRDEALASICPAGSYRPGSGVILADVVDDDGDPVPGARVDIETLQALVVRDTVLRTVKRSGQASPEGRFVVCGAAKDRALLLRATKDGQSAEATVREWGDGVVSITLALKPKGDV